MNHSLPEMIKTKLKFDSTCVINGHGEEHLSTKPISIKPIWKYMTVGSFIFQWLSEHWKNCKFVIENYDEKTFELGSPNLTTNPFVNKRADKCTDGNASKKCKISKCVNVEKEYQWYHDMMECKVGGRVSHAYEVTSYGKRV
jgi:hypothetical protein